MLGVAQLRDASVEDADRLPPPFDRRVRHVASENARVLAAVIAFEHGDREALRSLFAASHASMRDDYEVSIPAIDALVDRAVADPDVIAARLTGGGFGGSIVAIARAGTAAVAGARVVAAYQDLRAERPAVLVPMRPPVAVAIAEEGPCSPS